METIDKASSYLELNLMECGREICISDKDIVLSQKNYHLFHYINSGKGLFEIEGKTYVLSKGMVFYIPPNTQAHYSPDKNDPWTYTWLGFDGVAVESFLKRANISRTNPVLGDDDTLELNDCFSRLYDEYKKCSYLNVVCLGIGYELFGRMLNKFGGKLVDYKETMSYVSFAKEYIDNNYQFEVKIDDVANSVGVTPNYLANVFQKSEKMSPKQYLTKIRMEKAKLLLSKNQYKVKDVSNAVGYKNQLHFSNEFKKYYGCSPKNFTVGGEK